MVPYFPKVISDKGISVYFVCLSAVSLAFFSYSMSILWMLLGIIEVSVFFALSSKYSREWQAKSSDDYERSLFWIAVLVRFVWVVFSYFFYQSHTGRPFEYGAADSLAYHADSKWLAGENWSVMWNYLYKGREGYSDSGYITYLTVIYKIFGPNIFIARVLKCFISACTCILLYRFSSRLINEQVGRMVGVFAMLMPNLVVYCGLHLKETEMLFLVVAFLERSDFVLRSRRGRFWDILLPLVLAGVMFTFRTVLGVVSLFAFLTALVFGHKGVVTKGRRVAVSLWVLLAVAVLSGGIIMNEVEELWMNRDTNQEVKRIAQTSQGNLWAKYATGTVMAPMVFVLPFSTMVNTEQENQMMLHGGNYVRNFMGVFVVVVLYVVLFKKKNWRDFALIGSFVAGYLGIISMSGFAGAERFLLPGLPGLIIMWAYGVSELTPKSFKLVKYWYIVVPIMELGWAFFKIGSRGLM